MKQTWMALALLAGACIAGHEAQAAGWQPVFQSGSFVGSVTAPGSSAAATFSYPMSVNPTAFMPIYDAANALYTPLRTGWDTLIRDALAGRPEYRGHWTSVNGPMRIGYDGARVEVVAPALSARAKFEGEILDGLIKPRCDVTIDTGPLVLKASNIVTATGVLIEPVVSASPSHTISCSSNVWWVPILNDIVQDAAYDKALKKVQSLETGLVPILQAQLPASVFFGFPRIPAGKFVIGGVDYGAYITNNLPYLLSSTGFDVFIEDPNKIVAPQYGVVSTVKASLSFRGANAGLSFTLREDAKYVRKWVCDPGIPCVAP